MGHSFILPISPHLQDIQALPERSILPTLEVTLRRLGCRSIVGTWPACLARPSRVSPTNFQKHPRKTLHNGDTAPVKNWYTPACCDHSWTDSLSSFLASLRFNGIVNQNIRWFVPSHGWPQCNWEIDMLIKILILYSIISHLSICKHLDLKHVFDQPKRLKFGHVDRYMVHCCQGHKLVFNRTSG